MRERRVKLAENSAALNEIIADGDERARKTARKTLEMVRSAMNI